MAEKHYRLSGYLVWEDEEEKERGWVSFVIYPAGEDPENHEKYESFLSSLSGRVWIDEKLGITGLTSWRVQDGEYEFKTLEEADSYIQSLPPWNRTKYWLKQADIGESPVLLCPDYEEAPEDVQKAYGLSQMNDVLREEISRELNVDKQQVDQVLSKLSFDQVNSLEDLMLSKKAIKEKYEHLECKKRKEKRKVTETIWCRIQEMAAEVST